MIGFYRIRRGLLRYEIPSQSFGWPVRRRVRLLALLAVRNDANLLPGYVANVGPQADGIVALDDGSTDGSAEFLESRPEVLQVFGFHQTERSGTKSATTALWSQPGCGTARTGCSVLMLTSV